MAIWRDYPTSLSNANAIIYGKINDKIVNLNRAYRNSKGVFDHNTISSKKERAAQAFFSGQSSELGNPSAATHSALEDRVVKEYEKRQAERLALHRSRAIKARGHAEKLRLTDTLAAISSLKRARDASQEEAERIIARRAEQTEWDNTIKKIAHRTLMQANAQKIKDAHNAAVDKAMQMNIQKGIWGAFGGKSTVVGFLKGFGLWYGASTIGRMAKFLAYGNALARAKESQQAYITAAMTGASVGDLTSYGYALRPYGGGLSQAGSFFGKINQFAQGSLVGKGLGSFGHAALQYGLDITGSGPAGLATREQLIRRISDRLESMDEREKADFAESLEMDRASFMLMKDGFEKYQERMKNAEAGSPYLYGGAESLSKLAEASNTASSELSKLSTHIASSGVIQWWLDHFNNVIGAVNQRFTLNNARKAAAEYAGYGDSELTWGYTGTAEQKYKYFDFLERHGLHTEALEREHGTVGGYIFEKNWNEYLKQKSAGLTPYHSLSPMPNSGGVVQPQISIDVGDITISPSAKHELQQIIEPWIETNVINPLQQSVRP